MFICNRVHAIVMMTIMPHFVVCLATLCCSCRFCARTFWRCVSGNEWVIWRRSCVDARALWRDCVLTGKYKLAFRAVGSDHTGQLSLPTCISKP